MTLMETTAELHGIDTTPLGEPDPAELTELDGFRPVPNAPGVEAPAMFLELEDMDPYPWWADVLISFDLEAGD